MFLVGDAVQLMGDRAFESVRGLGRGDLKPPYDTIVESGAKFNLSGMYVKARELSQEEIGGMPVEFAMPN